MQYLYYGIIAIACAQQLTASDRPLEGQKLKVIVELQSTTLQELDPLYIKLTVLNTSNDNISMQSEFALLGYARYLIEGDITAKELRGRYFRYYQASRITSTKQIVLKPQDSWTDYTSIFPEEIKAPTWPFTDEGKFCLKACVTLEAVDYYSPSINIRVMDRPKDGIDGVNKYLIPLVKLIGASAECEGRVKLDASLAGISFTGELGKAVQWETLVRQRQAAVDDDQRRKIEAQLAEFQTDKFPVVRDLIDYALVRELIHERKLDEAAVILNRLPRLGTDSVILRDEITRLRLKAGQKPGS